MTEEQKAKMAAGREAARQKKETSETTETESFSKTDVEKMIAEAVKNALSTKITATDDKVTMVFMADVAPDNYIEFGRDAKYGSLTGSSGVVRVSREAFFGDFRTATIRDMLENRLLVVVDGLTDDEREQYGVNYKEGETLPPRIFEHLLDYTDKLVEWYPLLCRQYKDMVASKFAFAFERKDNRVTRDLLVALNELSKAEYAELPDDDKRKRGDFIEIIEKMDANYAGK